MKQVLMKCLSLNGFKILLLMIIAAGSSAYGQDISVNLNLPAGKLSRVLEELKKQTSYQFFYEDAIGNVEVGATKVTATTINQAMSKVLDGTGIDYKIDKKVIYLSKKSGSKTAPTIKPKKQITGTVVSASNNEPLVGVSVAVNGVDGRYGTITDFDGNFSLEVTDDDVVEFSYIGFVAQNKQIGSQTRFSVVLNEDNKLVDEVVVTALGIKREKKMLGYAIQDVKAEALNKTGDPSITSALQGKVAGLQMNTSSTGLSGSTKITLRGNSSLTDNNQPLWVVDGVPFNDSNDSGASLFGGVDRGGATVDINPDDIESISVLKGPNAAALYGSRAGNGVIVITTKKGTKSAGFGVNYSGSLTWTEVASTLDMQTKYGQGTAGVYNPNSWYSFGPLLDGHDYVGWNGKTMKFQKYGNKMKDYFQTGFAQTHNVAIGNVTETSNYRLSFGDTRSDGLFNNEKLSKTNIDLKAGMEMNKYLSVDSKISLSRTLAENRPVFGTGGEVFQLLFMPNNINLSDLKTFRDETHRHINWVGPESATPVLNPYYVNYAYTNMDERWRAFGYYSMKLNFTPWLYGTAKYSFDYYHTNIEDISRTNGIEDQTNERLTSKEDNYYEQNLEAILFGNNKLGDKLRIDYSIGVNEMYQKTHFLLGKSSNMKTPGYWYHNSALGLNAAEQDLSKRKSRSLFGTLQLSWDEYLSLDLTARNDWSSTLPADNNSYFYPSANLSFVFTDFMDKRGNSLPSWVTFGKVRLSAAQVGKDTDPYKLVTMAHWTQEMGGPKFTLDDAMANPDLKPELSSSFEGGLDMKFFNNRYGFDFTIYRSLTRNQIMTVPIASSSGFSAKWINAGEIENKGFELMLYATPYKTKDFVFDLNVNMARNISTVQKLDDGSKYISFNFRKDNLLVDVGAVEGGKLGDIYSNKSYQRNGEGKILTRNGLPLFVSGRSKQAIGNIQPNLLMSVTPSFTYKSFSLSALIDAKFGGNVVSMSEAVATGMGTAKRTELREKGIVIDGIDDVTGMPNTVEISAETYYKTIGSKDGVAEEFIYDASFIRFKELSLSYSVPGSVLKSTPFNSMRFSIVGRNLGYLLSHTPGTSPEGGFDTSMFSQAIDFTSVPYSRTFGFSLNLSF